MPERLDIPPGSPCAICGDGLQGAVLRDGRGRYLCERHRPDLVFCRFCERAMVPDGPQRNVCDICRKRAVTRAADAELRYGQLQRWFAEQGLDLRHPIPPLELRDAMPRRPNGLTMLGFTEKAGVRRMQPQRVVILRGLPAELFLTVTVHEMSHVWVARNFFPDLPTGVEEGICEWLSLQFARRFAADEGKFHAARIEQRVDPLYTPGLKHFSAYAEGKSPRDLYGLVRTLVDNPSLFRTWL